jgi:peptide/nickel transport system permease protein
VLAYAIRRALGGLAMIFGVTLITYVVFFRIPADPGKFLTGLTGGPAALRAADKKLGVDHPFYVQYYRFVDGLLHGQFGRSYASGEPVSDLLRAALPITASVVVGGVLLMLAAAVLLGFYSALHPHTAAERLLNLGTIAGVALHPLVVGLLLEATFAEALPIAPAGGYCGIGQCGYQHWAAHLVLPWVTFAVYLLPNYARVIRVRTLDILNHPHVAVARAKGASERQVLRRHVLWLLVPTLATMLAIDMSTALMAAIYIEAAFALPGLGTAALQAQQGALGFDLPVIVGVVTVIAVIVIVFNIVADIVAAWADPRIQPARR